MTTKPVTKQQFSEAARQIAETDYGEDENRRVKDKVALMAATLLSLGYDVEVLK